MTLDTIIFAANRFGDRSLSYPYYRLQEAGHSVAIATPGGESITGLHGVDFDADLSLDAVDPAAYDLLILPGGYASETIRMRAPHAIEAVAAFDAAGKPIASICHGAQLLNSAGIVDGRRLACHPSIRDDIERSGGTFVDEPAVVDDNLVTARDYEDVHEWLAALLAHLDDDAARGYDPIGVIRSPFESEAGMPIQGAFSDASGVVEVDERFADGLLDLEGFSHLLLVYEFHRSDGYDLRVQPFMEDDVHGVFATRAPRRPNPIGVSVVELDSVSDSFLFVEGIDVLDGTPLLDVKPFVPPFNGVEDASIGWLEGSIDDEDRRVADDRFLSES
ncbi:tRNA (Thr-GGU) A37 N-methylase [Halanaeroarchaeum sp. HSR-CO]|uniref:tRNA (N6-threonylcarbamoyladenosine(37)-N6)-methyltransferase TrmO n=1 Tax=Halanaeroarchaeum sp. HSR-CO TaxID=2866382 RepID=UPI00217E46B6|nr:tRNA (N6-threonylcarbamoyladenosine(37)-N6)-methyltransferase TrmO [Halanaeroarchaeum sp. HSR-CO]UWG46418.1 tRNA (Thr-GGU) A37 N-methylase [Halanaeroarchaeum sp. HSR-CO]